MSVLKIIKLSGYWEYSQELLKILNVEENKFLNSIPSEVNEGF